MQLCCPGTKDTELSEENDLYDDFNMDEVDLNFENYEELFGVSLSHSEELFENGGIDSLFGMKDMSAAEVFTLLYFFLPSSLIGICAFICYIFRCLICCLLNSLSMYGSEIFISLNVYRVLNYAIFLVGFLNKRISNTSLSEKFV